MTIARISAFLGILASLLSAAAVRAQPQDPAVARFDAYAQRTTHQWGVPGVAIALVRDGKLVAVRDYGVKTLGAPGAVDASTIFAIASVTKSFTAAAIAMLVDEHKLSWDDHVVQYLPELRLYSPEVTSELTIRDLLAQRTCLESTNLLTWNTPFDRRELIHRMRFLPPACPFRDRFVYNNLHYVLAGEIVSVVTGQSWDDFVQHRIFDPLGMTSSTTHPAAVAHSDHLATPYLKTGGHFMALPLFDEGASAPAGSIHSTATDMARWLLVQLGEGEVDGRRLWSFSASREMHAPQMVVARDSEYVMLLPDADFRSYGLGWFVYSYQGHTVVEHSGQSDGMQALVSMMPDHRLGIVVLTNTSLLGLATALTYRWYDDNLGRPPRDWTTQLLTTLAPINDALDVDSVLARLPHVSGTHPSLALDRYVGTYGDSLFGPAVVKRDSSGSLVLSLLGRTAPLTHWHFDTFHPEWRDLYLSLAQPLVTFDLDEAGAVRDLRLTTGETFTRSTGLEPPPR